MCSAAEEQARELGGSASRRNQGEVHSINLKRFYRAGAGLGAVEIDDIEKLAAAFRGEKHRAVGVKGRKRRIRNLLKGAGIGINNKHGDLAWITAGGK